MKDKAVIVAHYNENLDWLKNINQNRIIVYSKTNSTYNLVEKNKGQEIPCFLKYIIDFYNNLPERTLFLHGHRISGHMDFNSDEIVNKLHWELDNFFSINKRSWYQEISETKEQDQGAYSVWLKENWVIFQDKIPFPKVLKFYSGAQFVVHKKLILQYDKQFWINLYEWIQTTDLSNFITSRIFEYTWHYIFTKNPIEKEFTYEQFLR